MAVQSGACGKLEVGSSEVAEVRNWTFNMTSNNPKFTSSNATHQQHQQSVAGTKSGTLTFDVIYDDADGEDIFDVIRPGDGVTISAYYNSTKFFSIPCRIESMEFSDPIEEGEMLAVACEASTNGAWNYPDGSTSAAICS